MKRATSHPRGAAAVEFAFVLPVLMMIVMGTIDWGYFFYIQEIVVNSAREGARSGSLCVTGTPCATTVQSTAATATNTFLTNAGLKSVTQAACPLSGPGVCVELPIEPCGDPAGCPSVSVSLQYQVGSITGFLSRFLGISMPNAKATAVMRM